MVCFHSLVAADYDAGPAGRDRTAAVPAAAARHPSH